MVVQESAGGVNVPSFQTEALMVPPVGGSNCSMYGCFGKRWDKAEFSFLQRIISYAVLAMKPEIGATFKFPRIRKTSSRNPCGCRVGVVVRTILSRKKMAGLGKMSQKDLWLLRVRQCVNVEKKKKL